MQTPSGSDADCAVWLLINERPWDSDLRPETTELRRTSPSLRRSRYATEWPMSARFAANATISARRSNAANSASAIPWKRRCSSLTLPGCFPEKQRSDINPVYLFSQSRVSAGLAVVNCCRDDAERASCNRPGRSHHPAHAVAHHRLSLRLGSRCERSAYRPSGSPLLPLS